MRRLLPVAVSLALLAVIWWRLEPASLRAVVAATRPGWLAVSLAMAVPLTLLTALRLQQLAPRSAALGFGEANRLILAASVLNMVLPSKMGDLAKAWFMRRRGGLEASSALALVVFEKGCDLLSLLVWCVLGLALYPRKDALFWALAGAVGVGLATGVLMLGSRAAARAFFRLAGTLVPRGSRDRVARLQTAWDETLRRLRADRPGLARVGILSLFLWFLHLLQIWLFVLALGAWTPFLANLALAPLAILAGLLPFTFAGVGTRDAALVALYRPYMTAATAAVLGLLCTSRYLLPALAGLPLLGGYLSAPREAENAAPPAA
ncbi:MAG: flippase-like domain-containing protein [Gemmatimonadetes bacterium]|nr:flippase-like domain-containing protein [Gemmatimonadota bacterium]